MSYLKKYKLPLLWLRRHTSSRDFMLISSALVGFTAGMAAVILKTIVHYLYIMLAYGGRLFDRPVLLVVLPIIGILLTVVVVQLFFKGKVEGGTAGILYSIAQKSSIVRRSKMYSYVITSGITAGFGGSAGLESPIVVTGSAIGSNFGRSYHLNYRERTLLLACGAAAGVAAVFNAPVAGVLFAVEILLTDISIAAFIPLMIAAVVGTLCSTLTLDEDLLFYVGNVEGFKAGNIPFYMLLGALTGLISVYYTRTVHWIENIFEPLSGNVYKRALIGGLCLGLLIMLFPPLFGQGYESIKMLQRDHADLLLEDSWLNFFGTNEWLIVGFTGALALVKVIASTLTMASGGKGGNFGPSMFVGAFAGFFFSKLINLTELGNVPIHSFTMVGMAGILSGVMHAPLMGIFLIAEITGGYTLMIPLMVVSATSYAVVKYFEPYSLEAKKLAQRGELLTHNKDTTVLRIMKIRHLIETEFQPVSPDATLRELVEVIAHSRRNLFPVVNTKGTLEGIILLEDIREIMFKTDKYDLVKTKELMVKPPVLVQHDDSMAEVMKKFDESGAWNLPVVEGEKYLGFVSKSSIFTKYRKLLIKTTNV
ncbi:chloride channel protein [Pontibacter sp. BT310]|uniref:Chloride channel protein n=1 Tax=Pontibacter populi TaxID=890055 RepID=A0ABS6X9Q7_9BACT|nr:MULTISPECIES: chloride channel protein [Pontibacter]MBJ6117886.1 chloride channel protein [Pontibacter sp. BT310]MBR0570313.1 chloride channel protein [Microvirga sp. STS03]MBW3364739.1 chloride channel protein [Pontibacter populi]